MNETTVINSAIRDQKGKSAVKKLQRDGHIPAVVYGHNFAPISLALNASEINKLFKAGSEDSQEYRLYKLFIKKHDTTEDTVVVIKEIQRHPLTDRILHIDFFAVRMDEKIVAPVHIRLSGKAPGVKAGGIQRLILREIEVKSLPTDIPPHFDVDVSELEIGDSVHVNDLKVPDTVQILTDPNAPIVSILAPTVHKEEAVEEAAEEAASEAEAKPETAEAKEDSGAEKKE